MHMRGAGLVRKALLPGHFGGRFRGLGFRVQGLGVRVEGFSSAALHVVEEVELCIAEVIPLMLDSA